MFLSDDLGNGGKLSQSFQESPDTGGIFGYGVRNFKAFSETEPVRLAPVTLIFGPNSSGKSAFLQSLMMTKAFLENGKKDGKLLHLTANDGIHDHGSVQKLFYKQDVTKPIDFEFFYSPSPEKSKQFKIRIRFRSRFDKDGIPQEAVLESLLYGEKQDPISEWLLTEMVPDDWIESLGGESVWYGVYGFRPVNIEENIRKIMDDFRKKLDDLKNSLSALKKLFGKSDDDPTLNQLIGEAYEASRKVASLSDLSKHPEILEIDRSPLLNGFLDQRLVAKTFRYFSSGPGYLPIIGSDNEPGAIDMALTWNGEGEFSELVEEFYSKMEDLSFIGPSRSAPILTYDSNESDVDSVGPRGENSIYVIRKMQEDGLSIEVDRWFEKLGLPYSLRVYKTGDPTAGFRLTYRLKEKNLNIDLSLNDVGFGVSQVLPILVEGISKVNNTILVEQPELHLHPKMQADLADFFLENSKKQHNQWIIETHSELLILRILRRIRQGVISNEDVSVLYINQGKDGAEIQELRVNETGDFLDPWPHGFFDEDVIELFGDDK